MEPEVRIMLDEEFRKTLEYNRVLQMSKGVEMLMRLIQGFIERILMHRHPELELSFPQADTALEQLYGEAWKFFDRTHAEGDWMRQGLRDCKYCEMKASFGRTKAKILLRLKFFSHTGEQQGQQWDFEINKKTGRMLISGY